MTHPLEHSRAELNRHVVLCPQVLPQLGHSLVCLDVGDGVAGVEGLLLGWRLAEAVGRGGWKRRWPVAVVGGVLVQAIGKAHTTGAQHTVHAELCAEQCVIVTTVSVASTKPWDRQRSNNQPVAGVPGSAR